MHMIGFKSLKRIVFSFTLLIFLIISLNFSAIFANNQTTELVVENISYERFKYYYFASPLTNISEIFNNMFFVPQDKTLKIIVNEGKILKLNVVAIDLDIPESVKFIFLPPFNESGYFFAKKSGVYNSFVVAYDNDDYNVLPLKIVVLKNINTPQIIAPEIEYFKEGENATLEYYVYPKDVKVYLEGIFKEKNKLIQYNESGSYIQYIKGCNNEVCVQKKIKVFIANVNRLPQIKLKINNFHLNNLSKELKNSIEIYDPDGDEIEVKIDSVSTTGIKDDKVLVDVDLRLIDSLNTTKKRLGFYVNLDNESTKFAKWLNSVEKLELKEFQEYRLDYELPNYIDTTAFYLLQRGFGIRAYAIQKKIEKNILTLNIGTDDVVKHKFVLPFIKPSKKITMFVEFGINQENFQENDFTDTLNKLVIEKLFSNLKKRFDLKIVDVNRLPKITKTMFKEGEVLDLKIIDEDNDRFMTKLIDYSPKGNCELKLNEKIGFDCAGNYKLKIKINDFFDEIIKEINISINDTPQQIYFKRNYFVINESQNLMIDLTSLIFNDSKEYNLTLKNIYIEDINSVNKSYEKGIINWIIKENSRVIEFNDFTIVINQSKLILNFSHDFANHDITRQIKLEFLIQNKYSMVKQNITVEVRDVDRSPVVKAYLMKKYFDKLGYKNAIINITIVDPDNDPIEYFAKIDGIKINKTYFKVKYAKTSNIEIYIKSRDKVVKKLIILD